MLEKSARLRPSLHTPKAILEPDSVQPFWYFACARPEKAAPLHLPRVYSFFVVFKIRYFNSTCQPRVALFVPSSIRVSNPAVGELSYPRDLPVLPINIRQPQISNLKSSMGLICSSFVSAEQIVGQGFHHDCMNFQSGRMMVH